MKKYGAAIIGCGAVAGGYDQGAPSGWVRTHIRAYHSNPRIKVVAVCDRSLSTARKFARDWKVPHAFSTIEEMFRHTSPVIVSVCVPDDFHGKVLRELLSYPSVRAVWCEKPLVTRIAEGRRLVADYKRRGISLVVNFQRAWEPEHLRVEKWIKEGKLGEIQTVTAYYTKGIKHNGSHVIYLLLSWFGKLDSVKVLAKHVDYTQKDPTVDAILRFGKVRVHLVGLKENFYSHFEIDIFGAKGRFQLLSGGDQIASSKVQADLTYPGYKVLSPGVCPKRTKLNCAMGSVVQKIVQTLQLGRVEQVQAERALLTAEICCKLVSLGSKVDHV